MMAEREIYVGKGEGNEQKEHPFSQQLGVEERECRFPKTRGNDDRFREKVNDGKFRLRTMEQFDDQGLLIRDSQTTSSRFQWTNFLPGSRNSRVDSMEGFQDFIYDNYGRKYARVVDESTPFESERNRNVPACAQVGVSEHNGLARNPCARVLGDGNQFQAREYPPLQDREMSKVYCDEASWPRFRSCDNTQCLTPRSQSSGQNTPSRGIPKDSLRGLHQEFNHPSEFCVNGTNVQPESCDDYRQILQSKSGSSAHPYSNKTVNRHGAEHTPTKGRAGDHIHLDNQRINRLHVSAFPEDGYDKVQNVQCYNDQGNACRSDALDYNLQRLVSLRNSHRRALKMNELWNSGDASQRKPTLGNHGVRRHINEAEYEGGTSVHRDTYHEYGPNAIESQEALLHKEECDHGTDDQAFCCEEEDYYFDELPNEFCTINDVAQQSMKSKDFGHEQNSRMFKRKQRFIESQEALLHKEACDYGTDDQAFCCEEEEYYFDKLPNEFCTIEEDTQHSLKSKDFVHEQNSRMFKRKQRFAGIGTMSMPKRRAITIGSRGALSHDYMLFSVESEKTYVPSSTRRAKESFRVCKDQFGGLSEALQSRLSKPDDSDRGDIQRRLKHPNIDTHACQPHSPKFRRKHPKCVQPYPYVFNTLSTTSQPHGSMKSTKFKNRLKPVPQMLLSPLSISEACHSQEADLDHLKLKVKPLEKDLPEHSEDFKRQVNEWFLKSMLLLNANPGRQKRFKEQGKAGCLRCIICSSSKEFMETKDVALHAFASTKVGFRVQHLGFHRALCVLMGWDTGLVPNSIWICQSLPDDEAWALKADIIIWPPVVIIHNSFAEKDHLNDQMKISIQHLTNLLRDDGFDERKMKVFQGKAGNPNIMVVKFSGTLSGLEEAERLHCRFAEKEHGRDELQHATGQITCSEDAPLALDEAKDGVYGYLGIVEDLDKLHYDLKRYCSTKSKKEILAFANATTQ